MTDVHGEILVLSIKGVSNDYKQQKRKKRLKQVPWFACY